MPRPQDLCLYKFIYIVGGLFNLLVNHYILTLTNDMTEPRNNITATKKKKKKAAENMPFGELVKVRWRFYEHHSFWRFNL